MTERIMLNSKSSKTTEKDILDDADFINDIFWKYYQRRVADIQHLDNYNNLIVTIHIVNLDNQIIKKIEGELLKHQIIITDFMINKSIFDIILTYKKKV